MVFRRADGLEKGLQRSSEHSDALATTLPLWSIKEIWDAELQTSMYPDDQLILEKDC